MASRRQNYRDDIVYDDDAGTPVRRRVRTCDDGDWRDWADERAAGEARVERELAKRRAEGAPLRTELPQNHRDLSGTFWGQAWNRNLMAYSDYENRMPRGRSYFRSGRVMDMEITKGVITATVAGTRIYSIRIAVKPLKADAWAKLKDRCQGKIGGLMELLSGSLSAEVMAEVTRPESGLFPAPKDILLTCSCPDYAGLCKHVAATLYATGGRLDHEPALLFTLRGIDPNELIAGSSSDAIRNLTAPATIDDARSAALQGIDFAAMFGIDDVTALLSPVPEEPAAPAKPRAKKRAVKKP